MFIISVFIRRIMLRLLLSFIVNIMRLRRRHIILRRIISIRLIVFLFVSFVFL